MANKRRKGGKIGRPPKIIVNTDGIESSLTVRYTRKCGHCNQKIVSKGDVLAWETFEFCNKSCLEKYQIAIGSKCTNCNANVNPARFGKLCVRVGYKINQFCNTTCLNKYITEAKVCALCHKDITRDASTIFADVGGGESKDFCTESCKIKYARNANDERHSNSNCVTCKRQTVSVELEHDSKVVLFCGSVCYSAYKFTHNLESNQCKGCQIFFENKRLEENSMFYDGGVCSFCSPACKNRYINKEKEISQCSVCNIQKYSFDLILVKADPLVMTCSLKCLRSYESSSNTSTPTSSMNGEKADKQPMNISSFLPKAVQQIRNTGTPSSTTGSSESPITISTPIGEITELPIPRLPAPQRNVATMCKVKVAAVSAATGTDLKPTKTTGTQKVMETRTVEVQTDLVQSSCLPIPIPVCLPVPLMMYSAPYPVPFPFPLPLPVPIFIPTSKRTHKGVTKRIKKILDRSLQDPLQDEMLLLAEMASKSTNNVQESSSESESEPEPPKKNAAKAAPKRNNNRGGRRVSFSNDVNNRAPPRRARVSKQNVSYVDYDNDAVDLAPPRPPKRTNKRVSFNDVKEENDKQVRNNRRVMFADEADDKMFSTPFSNRNNRIPDNDMLDDISDSEAHSTPYREPPPSRNFDLNNSHEKDRKRRSNSPNRSSNSVKRSRPTNHAAPPQRLSSPPAPDPTIPKQLPPIHELFKKPDNEMHLKYPIGVSAWTQWSLTKHQGRFNPDLLQLPSEELDEALCLFINEVQKPNGQVYTPDTIFYFCLGIQQHLFLNGRTDNLFYSPNYQRFTDCLDEIAKKFLVMYNDSEFIVTRIEEEHLWESKQLGAHSPQVLLNTLLFFNTKYFHMTLVEEHKNLLFSHIAKNTKYNNSKAGRTRSFVLRYYPNGREAYVQQGKPRRKRGFEQAENEDNPLRCPIRLYEFYISKCPNNISESNECFYLLPDTSCLPESSVWYSPMPVPDNEIEKVLNRFKIVREVTMALLAK